MTVKTLTNLLGFIALALGRDGSQIEGHEGNEDVARIGPVTLGGLKL
jgi:hypothetical protein